MCPSRAEVRLGPPAFPAGPVVDATSASAGERLATLHPADRVAGRGHGVRPSRRAALALGAIAVLAVALPVPYGVPLFLVALLAGGVLVDMVLARRRVPAWHRTRPPVLARAVPSPFTLTADPHPARAERVRQPVTPALAVDPSEARGGELRGSLTGRLRGVHPLPPSVVRVEGPLGLATCDHRGADPTALTVYPDLPRARRLAEARRRGRSGEAGRIRSRIGLGTEFETIRDYSPDDDVRQINWLASARAARPLSNQYRVDENRDLLCLVDAGRLMCAPVGEASRLDVVLDAVAVLAVAADESGDRVGTLAFSADILRVLPPRRRGAEAVVRALFDLEPAEVESDYERAFQAVGGRKRTLIVMFTDLVDAAAGRTLIAAVPALLRRHAVVVVSCRDPELYAALRAVPAVPLDVLRAAASADLAAGRRRTVSMLRALGAVVVEADAAALGPATVDAYLRLKNRARA